MKGLFKVVLSIATLWLSFVSASAQQEPQPSSLTLQQAVTIALEKNPLRKAGIADTKAASAGVREARSFLMPHLSFSETATRGNDPVYVFGSELRQRRFTVADFALNKLNTPLCPSVTSPRGLEEAGTFSTHSPAGTASIRQNR